MWRGVGERALRGQYHVLESSSHPNLKKRCTDNAWTSRLCGNGKEGRVDNAGRCHSRLARNGKTAFSPVVRWCAGLARDRCSCGRSCAGCSVSQRGACTPLVSQGLPSGSSPAPAPESLQEHRAHLNTVRCQSPRMRVCLRESSCEGKRQHTFLRVLMLSLSGGCLSTQVACAPW